MPFKVKQPKESILYDLPMAGIAQLGGTDKISTVNSVTSTGIGLVITQVTHNSNSTVQCRIAGGTHLSNYKITAVVTTLRGDTLESDVELRVREL